jgi:hypothetical protein
MANNTFFMVYLQGGDNPKYIHSTLESAETEAKRLSRNFKVKAFVLCSIKSFEIMEFKVEDCRPAGDALPF